MVACDNKECDIKWYHISCVGMTGVKVTAKKVAVSNLPSI